jgi:hypothetical protein
MWASHFRSSQEPLREISSAFDTHRKFRFLTWIKAARLQGVYKKTKPKDLPMINISPIVECCASVDPNNDNGRRRLRKDTLNVGVASAIVFFIIACLVYWSFLRQAI